MTTLQLNQNATKQEIFATVQDYLSQLNLGHTDVDDRRPWGGFFVIDESHTSSFINAHFPELTADRIGRGGKLSPKILIVEPGKRLSWQYHDRREELWRVVKGPVGVITSDDDTQKPVEEISDDQIVQFGTNIRHRLVGLDNWGVVAEIWQHTDPTNPSDEDDIVRVEDDFGR